ncbi:IclR family transcriptional regulator [Priestia megaterium]|nr:IclR family transcriptional regulator [Priestia megaterium]
MSEVGTLKKGLDIFSLLLAQPNMTIPEMMDVLQFNKSTMYRLVSTLEQNGFIERNEDHRYTISKQLVQSLLHSKLPTNYELNWFSVPPMQELNERTNETIYAGILHRNEMVTTQVVSGEYYSTRTHSEVGSKKAVHANGIGKCILAYQSHDVQENMINQLAFEPYISHTIVNRQLFKQELLHIKERGYAIDNEEGELGVRCIAAPIFKRKEVIAAIALAGPSVRVSADKDEWHAQLVKACAAHISNAITYYE